MTTMLMEKLQTGDVIEIKSGDDVVTVLVLLATDDALVLDPCDGATPVRAQHRRARRVPQVRRRGAVRRRLIAGRTLRRPGVDARPTRSPEASSPLRFPEKSP